MTFLLLSVIVAAIFYGRLPAEIAYHFQGDMPDRTITLKAFTTLVIAPQVVFVLMAITLTRIVLMGAKYAPQGETPLKHLLPVMGNMIALPQIILFVAMLQLFLYNAYHTGVIPLWIPAVAVLALGGIILAVYFIRIIRRYRKRKV